MAFQCPENLDDGELWLPSDFLSDESPPKERLLTKNNRWRSQFPCEFSHEWSSNGLPLDSSSYNSPVESIVGSTETESDEEDDYTAGLAERIARSMLEDDENTGTKEPLHWASTHKFFLSHDTSGKSNTMARSPQSTLSAVGSWTTCSLGSGNSTGSSKGPSQVSSPPSTPLAKHNDAWDLLYAAAGEVVRLNMNGVNATAPPPPRQAHAQGCFALAASHSSSSQSPSFLAKDLQTRSCSFSGFPSKDRVNTFQTLRRSWTDKTSEEDQKIPSHQYGRQPRQNHVVGWGKQGKPVQAQLTQIRAGNKPGVGNHRSFRGVEYSSPPWPPVQQGAAGSGMRAVFLGSSGPGRESGGTGVFLPRRIGSNSNLRKKPACSTVLLPSRIVEALNLNVEDMSSQPNLQCNLPYICCDGLDSMPAASPPATIQYGGRPNDHYKSMVRNGLSEQQKKSCNPVRTQIHAASSEICLPQEWTY